jgi:diamine N-acetyltransferase
MKEEDSRIILRAIEPSDIDLLYNWENDPDVWRVSNTITPYSKYILQKYIENSHLDIYQTRQLRLMIELVADKTSKYKTVGAVDIFDFDPYHLRAGIGILIGGKKDRNQGIATMALHELIRYAFTVLGLHQLFCNITIDNKASLRLFEKVGFTVTGIKKEWIKFPQGYTDELILQLINPSN